MGKILLGILIAIILVFSAFTWLTLHWSYSEGERAGFVQKFSRKGWICKTWEGELAMVSLPGAAPEKFYFTVRDEATAESMNRSIGQWVRLHYEQHRGLPGTCFGETGYWVDAVSPIDNAATAPQAAQPPASSAPPPTATPPQAPATGTPR